VQLTDDGRCAVYPLRPLACRGFKSGNAVLCAQAFADAAMVPSGFVDGVAIVLGVAAAWSDAAARRGDREVPELHLALADALDAIAGAEGTGAPVPSSGEGRIGRQA
jgi:Fe-S-cluster containining protein